MRTYIFDLDDTLYREHDYVLSGLRAVAEHVSRELRRRRTGAALYATMRTEFLEHGRGNVFQRCVERHNLRITPRSMLMVYQHHTPRGLHLYDDARRLLDRLPNDYGIVSNSPAEIGVAKLAALGLDCPAVWGAQKKHVNSVGFRSMAAWLGARYDDCVYVGDDPRYDFMRPRTMGWWTIRIVRDYGDNMQTPPPMAGYEPHQVVRSLDEIEA